MIRCLPASGSTRTLNKRINYMSELTKEDEYGIIVMMNIRSLRTFCPWSWFEQLLEMQENWTLLLKNVEEVDREVIERQNWSQTSAGHWIHHIFRSWSRITPCSCNSRRRSKKEAKYRFKDENGDQRMVFVSAKRPLAFTEGLMRPFHEDFLIDNQNWAGWIK